MVVQNDKNICFVYLRTAEPDQKSGRKGLMKAAVMDDDPNLTMAFKHIDEVKNIVPQSHMMELLHRSNHSDCRSADFDATSYNSLSAALYKFIECYADIDKRCEKRAHGDQRE